jgi:cation diffusion facilitator CzcD-associated flavoprotein CzcO
MADSAIAAPDHHVAVIGAGPGGIAAGVFLQQAGVDDFVMLDRAEAVGGSWRDNDYPGIGVDVPSLAYQYSFARNPRWTRVFAKGDEVLAYHEGVVERFGLERHLRLETDVVSQRWDDEAHLWRLEIADGREITARFLITAVGAFINPIEDPGIPGLDDYRGKVQRPTDWDHSYDLAGKRAAVIGTGASSVQITPKIAQEVAHLEVFQRTPVWCLPKPDFSVPPLIQDLLRIPGLAAGLHGAGLAGMNVASRAMVSTPTPLASPLMRAIDNGARRAYRAYLAREVHDPETAEALTPDYGPFAKRPTISNTYLAAFNRDNVDLVTTPIDRITEDGLRTADGADHPADMLVLATGYELFSDPESYRPGDVTGTGGFDLGEYFAAHRLQAYESVAVPQLPNRWMLVGPYSWTGTGWHALVEVSARHAVRAIGEADRRGATAMSVRQSAHDAYHERVRRQGRNIQHYFGEINKGVRTYYVNSQGDMPYIRPSTIFEARWRSTHFPIDDYAFESLPASPSRSPQTARSRPSAAGSPLTPR